MTRLGNFLIKQGSENLSIQERLETPEWGYFTKTFLNTSNKKDNISLGDHDVPEGDTDVSEEFDDQGAPKKLEFFFHQGVYISSFTISIL